VSKIFSFFSPPKQEPATPAPAPGAGDDKGKKKKRKAAFLASKKTGPGGVLGEANVGRQKILV